MSDLSNVEQLQLLISANEAVSVYKPNTNFEQELYSLVDSFNENTSEVRAVPIETAIKIYNNAVSKNLVASAEYRHLSALREVNEYMNVAIYNKKFSINKSNVGFLPLGHPQSFENSLYPEKAVVASAEWIAGDPNVPSELRPMVASALQTEKNSVERSYVANVLLSIKTSPRPKSVILELI